MIKNIKNTSYEINKNNLLKLILASLKNKQYEKFIFEFSCISIINCLYKPKC